MMLLRYAVFRLLSMLLTRLLWSLSSKRPRQTL